ncbi:MAG: hypothetical protein ABIJ09_14330 [Pseudomonadota bacterium]
MHDDDFPELRELQAMQKKRHRQVIAGLLAGGVASMAGGLAIFGLAGGENPALGGGAVGIVLIGVGAIMIGRALVSAFTDIDTRVRDDLIAPILPDDGDDEAS